MSIQKNVEALAAKLDEVKNHCMCATFEDRGGFYRVLYPLGFQLDGVQAEYSLCGKLAALDRMLNAMERHWKGE